MDDVKAISISSDPIAMLPDFAMAIRTDGQLLAFGATRGLGFGGDLLYPYEAFDFTDYDNNIEDEVIFARTMRNAAQVEVGASHTLVLTASDGLWAFGNNAFGQLGDGNERNYFGPVRIID